MSQCQEMDTNSERQTTPLSSMLVNLGRRGGGVDKRSVQDLNSRPSCGIEQKSTQRKTLSRLTFAIREALLTAAHIVSKCTELGSGLVRASHRWDKNTMMKFLWKSAIFSMVSSTRSLPASRMASNWVRHPKSRKCVALMSAIGQPREMA